MTRGVCLIPFNEKNVNDGFENYFDYVYDRFPLKLLVPRRFTYRRRKIVLPGLRQYMMSRFLGSF